MLKLTLAAARALALAAQGLHQATGAPTQKADVLAAVRRMQALQIDSISVVARSPYLVLWSRLGSYEPRWLDELLAEGALFEYWAHAACLLPIEDYGLYRREMLDGHPRARAWIAAHPEPVAHVRDRLRTQGAVRAADFPRTDGRTGTWWDWKPEKQALECLFAVGEVVCARRECFQRVYDLRERVFPGWDDRQVTPADATRRAFILKAVQALGLAPARWVPGYFNMSKRGIAALLDEMAAAGQVVRVAVDGWEGPVYVDPANLALAEQAAAGTLVPMHTTLLSPFDPLIWDRARVQELFGFAYRIETYTRAEQRQFGYFTLPILHRGALVGRLDPKAHRRAGVFEVRMLHLEPGVAVTDELVAALASTLRACATWHLTPEVIVRRSDPPELTALVQAALDEAPAPSPGSPPIPRDTSVRP